MSPIQWLVASILANGTLMGKAVPSLQRDSRILDQQFIRKLRTRQMIMLLLVRVLKPENESLVIRRRNVCMRPLSSTFLDKDVV
jgi:hypothetical protein